MVLGEHRYVPSSRRVAIHLPRGFIHKSFLMENLEHGPTFFSVQSSMMWRREECRGLGPLRNEMAIQGGATQPQGVTGRRNPQFRSKLGGGHESFSSDSGGSGGSPGSPRFFFENR